VIDFDALYRRESRRVLATLIRLLHDFDLAEDALSDAFVAAAAQWPRDGVPEHPTAWLVAAGRYAALGRLRRRARFERIVDQHASELVAELEADAEAALEPRSFEQDRLRLIFTCCHPELAADAQLALTLREVCGLSTEQIAAAFLVKPATIAQRIVRTKRKIIDSRIPYQVPAPEQLPERLELVLHVIYLMFNEGYAASSGERVTSHELCAEAIGLGRWLAEHLPAADVFGLLALLLLQDSRRGARSDERGELVLLAEQDRTRWSRSQIDEGLALLERAWREPPVASYTLQAAMAAVHARARSSRETDWAGLVQLYDLLLVADPSPVVELNRAVAVAERDGAGAGLALVDAIHERGALAEYRLLHAARADLLRRLGRSAEAAAAYRRALELTVQAPERRFLERRLAELTPPQP
jgi:RNA polymerase sigma-70 factor, ECF subfamily